MNKAEKPEFTDEMRAKLNSMVRLLYKRFYTKQELNQRYKTIFQYFKKIIKGAKHEDNG